MLFLLSAVLFASIQADATIYHKIQKICNYYPGSNDNAVLRWKKNDEAGWNSATQLLIPKNSCNDAFGFGGVETSNMKFQAQVTVDTSVYKSDDMTFDGTCDSQAVAFIVPSATDEKPTVILKASSESEKGCVSTDIFTMNFCKSGTNVKCVKENTEGANLKTLQYLEGEGYYGSKKDALKETITWSGDNITPDIVQTVEGKDMCDAPKSIYKFIYEGDDGKCQSGSVEYMPEGGDCGDSSSAVLFTFLAVVLAILQF